MVFHINRMAFKSGVSEEQRRACLDTARQAGAANPAVKSYAVRPGLGPERRARAAEFRRLSVMKLMSSLWKRSRRRLFRAAAVLCAVAVVAGGMTTVAAAPARADQPMPAGNTNTITYPGGDLVGSYDLPGVDPASLNSFLNTYLPDAVGLAPGASLSALAQSTWQEYSGPAGEFPDPPSFSGGSISASSDGAGGSTITVDVPAAAAAGQKLNPVLAGLIGVVAGGLASVIVFGACETITFAIGGATLVTTGPTGAVALTVLGTRICAGFGAAAWTFTAGAVGTYLTNGEITPDDWKRILATAAASLPFPALGKYGGPILRALLKGITRALVAMVNGITTVVSWAYNWFAGGGFSDFLAWLRRLFTRATQQADTELGDIAHQAGIAAPSASGAFLNASSPGAAGGNCMDAYDSGGEPSAGQPVTINACNGNAAQYWDYYPNGLVAMSGLCMDTKGGTFDGSPLVNLEQCDGSSSQEWTQNGSALVNAATGNCLDDPNGVTTPGTGLITYPCNGLPVQQWLAPTPESCDIYASYGTSCVAAYSATRALYAGYDGPLYQVQRSSDGTTMDIGLLAAGGDVNASEQDSFCANTTCTIDKIYDQSPLGNNLTVEQGGGANGSPDQPAVATALPVTIGGGNEAYGLDIEPGTGYRDDATDGIATSGEPEGMYMVASGTHVNSGCCFDFGNAEANNNDNGPGHMDAVNLTTYCGNNNPSPCSGGPWVEADMEDGQWTGSAPNTEAASNSDYVTAMVKNNGTNTMELEGGNSQSGGLTTFYNGALPSEYPQMALEGGIVLGTGGDNSNSDIGSFFEGVMTAGFPSDAADAAVQANIVAAGYAGNTNPVSSAAASAAGPAVVHSTGASTAYSSVFTVDSSNGHLQESWLPYMNASWSTHDLSSTATDMAGTPAVMPGTQPVALVHCGYTSVYTIDAGDGGHGTGDLQETWLPAIGGPWYTQDLSQNYHTPPTDATPTAVEHLAGVPNATPGCGYTSVYTVARNGHLWETYLPNAGFPGDSWDTQDLSSSAPTDAQTPAVLAGTSPVAVVHCGFTSVYTVDATNHHLQETWLPAVGGSWATQDLSRNYGTAGATTYDAPPTSVTPTAVVHSAGAAGGTPDCGFTSVFTVDDVTQDLQETYLPNTGFPGDAWVSQNLTAISKGPGIAPGTAPVALVHMGFTSIYTVAEGSNHLQETWLPYIGFPGNWQTQDLSRNYGVPGATTYNTPPTDQAPIVLLHPDASGVLDWTSVFTIDEFNDHLQESYLPNTGFPGDAWVTHDLGSTAPTMPGTPPVAVLQSQQADWSVAHDGYTSTYTVDSSGNLWETYLPAMGKTWVTQNLTAMTSGPAVAPNTTPVAIVHDGYTSVFTHDKGSGDLQETWLPALGGPWYTHDLSSNAPGMAQTPQIAQGSTPTAVFHDGYLSVYTLDVNGDLQETYLAQLGGNWVSQDLTTMTSGPISIGSFTNPVAIVHDGYVSVFTEDEGDSHTNPGDLQETYLAVLGGPWATHDLSEMAGTTELAAYTNPTVVFHDGFLSVYTVNDNTGSGYGDLEETYLPAIGDKWVAQDLTANYGAPVVTQFSSPVALYHTGFTSVYYLKGGSGGQNHLIEAYLPAISDAWGWHDLSANAPFTPAPGLSPSPLVHYDTNGGLTWTSVFTIDGGSNDLQETYLPAIGNSWATQNLSTESPPATPPW